MMEKMTKKIMILGASILQVPAIKAAKKMGIYTIAVDMNPEAIGFKDADKSLIISTIDTEKVLEVAIKEKVDGIITLASDMPMRTVAIVSKKMNLIGLSEETALKATNKYEMRKALLKNDVPIPKFYRANTEEDYKEIIKNFSEKYIVKPADNSGSRGIFLVQNNTESIKAFKYAKQYSRNGDVLVEEFMEGNEVSVESITINGITNVITITDKLTTGAPKFVEIGHSEPSILPEGIKEKIKNITKRAIKAIGIENGPSHTEIIVTKEGPKIVEIGARLGGDCITSHLVPLSTGVDMVKATIEIALGDNPNIDQKLNKCSAIRFFDQKNGRIKNIQGVNEAKNIQGVQEINFTKNIGDEITNINNSTDRIGYVISQGNSVEDAIRICEEVKNKILIDIE